MAGELRRNGNQSTYGYTAGSNLIAGLTETTGSNFAQTRTYLANRNLLDIVETKVSTASKAKFDYDHDALGRRANAVHSGEMFSRYLNGGLHTAYGYNDRSELTSAQTWQGTSLADNTYPVAGRNYGYAYDNIGNRTSTSVDGSGPSYTTNNLNQYTQTNRYPGYTVTGLAPAAATVTVNGATATRQGEYFHHWVGAGSASTPVWWNLNIVSSYGGSETRNTWTPASPQTYNYDLDGNLLTDDRWAYTWDAENRLIAMETIAAAYNAGAPRQKLEFTYDYLGRRVRKLVRGGWNGSAYTTVVSETRFLYDGWNLIAEYDALTPPTLTLTRRYVWSGSASNPGSLLAITHASGTVHLPAYDGNGNLLALVNRSTGAIEAAYEYDAFGRTIRATGAYAQVNPFRFSTKYTDNETQLVYYGFRYYDPKNGRFLGRDPIEEKGGLHLYAFVRNNPVNAWDYLGMAGMVDYSVSQNDDGSFYVLVEGHAGDPDHGWIEYYTAEFATEEQANAWGSDMVSSLWSYYSWGWDANIWNVMDSFGEPTPGFGEYALRVDGVSQGLVSSSEASDYLVLGHQLDMLNNPTPAPNNPGLRNLDAGGTSAANQQGVNPATLAAHQSAKERLLGLKDTQGVEWSILIRKGVVDGKTTYSLSDPISGTTGSVGPVALRQFQTDASVVGLSHLHTGVPQLSAYDFITAIHFGKDISSVYGKVGELYVFPSGVERAARESYSMEWHRALEADPRMWKNTIETRFDNRPASGTNVFFGPGTLTDF